MATRVRRMRHKSRGLGWDVRTTYRMFARVTALTLIVVCVWVVIRLSMVIGATGARPADRILAALLLAAEMFMAFHAVGFFSSLFKASRQELLSSRGRLARHSSAPVAVLITAFNESEEVLEHTIASVVAMDYPAMRVYLVDDSTRPESYEGAQRLADKYGITLVHRANRAGYKAGAINDLLPRLSEPYVAILDADQRPVQAWLKEVVSHLEEDPGLAFVQVPQIYVNTELPVARTARYQQAIFFEYICEGKSASNAMFCCGSNVVIRREALLSVERVQGGRRHFFDETSVTEDFATTVRMHALGWRTAYLNRTLVVGMGPETLPGYFTQQMRWAMGTMGVGLGLLRQLLRTPRMLAPAQWWEYLLSGTYYFVGFANFIFMLAPIAFIAFDVRPFRTPSDLYLIVFIPYFALSLNVFFLGMSLRGYPFREIWLASALSFSTFWTYMKAAIVALFGLKRAFGVTPKGVGGSVPLLSMNVELAMFAATSTAAAAGLLRMALTGVRPIELVNVLWAGYHALMLSTLFVHFNRPVSISRRQLLFQQVPRQPFAAEESGLRRRA